MENNLIKPPVEIRYKEELDMLRKYDDGKKPENWVLSPKAVRTFILGGKKKKEKNHLKFHENFMVTMLSWKDV